MTACPRQDRRAFATLLVLWIVAIAAIIIGAIQASAFSQAAKGREALARVRAHWAARAGVEAALARIENATLSPTGDSAYEMLDDVADAAEGGLDGAAYRLSYESPDGERLGGADAHAKININLMNAQQLALLPEMPEDGPDAILDWIDEDDDSRPLGAESAYYLSKQYGYPPRNGPIRTLAELELVVGLTPELVRGEDWNLNGRLDPNEDDGDLTMPDDNADGKLDAGWSAILTCRSVDGGRAASGEERLDLAQAQASEIARRLAVDPFQAEAIATYAGGQNATMSEFLRRRLSQTAQRAGMATASSVRDLTRDQLTTLFNEASIGEAAAGRPGKLNINTCDAETLQYLPEISPVLADAIVYERASRPEGFVSIVDLLDVPAMTRQRLAGLTNLLDVRSNVVVVTSRGRDTRTGIEVEMTATVDRTAVPATITECLIR